VIQERQQPKRKARKHLKEDLPRIWLGYGRLLRRFRERAGLSREQFAERVAYSPETIASIEQARRPAKRAFTERAEEILDARGVLETLQEDVDLAKLPQFFIDFATTELEAVSRYAYDSLLVPGLLQTEAYMRAVFAMAHPALDEETTEQRLDARLSRQRLLTRTPFIEFCFIIWEPALRCVVGDPEVMEEQLRHLVEIAKLHNVEIQVMPLAHPIHPGLNGPFVLLETDEHRHVGYFESQGVPHVITDPHMVSELGVRYGQAALAGSQREGVGRVH
jgi:transcriptional regulator with XRE-family HTH domain